MIKTPLTEKSLRAAFRRIEDFQAVQAGKEEYKEAFTVLRDSLGLDDELRESLAELTYDFFEEDAIEESGFEMGILFGLMIGLIATDHASEA